jgi:magnesium chelatase subunit D
MNLSNLPQEFTNNNITVLAAQIYDNLSQNRGFRLGESTVASLYVHRPSKLQPGVIQVLVTHDAGQEQLHEKKPGQAIHLDIYHASAEVEIGPLVKRFSQALESWLDFQHLPAGTRRDSLFSSLTSRIILQTAIGDGKLTEILDQLSVQKKARHHNKNHVHMVLQHFSRDEYSLIPFLVDAVETELAQQGVEIRKVEKVLHVESQGPPPDISLGLEAEQQKLWRLASLLSSLFSSPGEGLEFLESFTLGMFRSRQLLANLRNKHGYLREMISDMAEAGLINQGVFANTLSKDGKKLLDFIAVHQQELESELRQAIRQISSSRSHYRSVRHSNVKSTQKEYSYTSKTTNAQQDAWLGNIALPETLVQASKHRFMEHRPRLAVGRDDIQVYRRQVNTPIDVCLLIDGSASMAGPKIKAVWQLAEHLLLTTRDRVAVVIFQEHEARIEVPFTRNYTRLKMGLRSINPHGLTPLAEGFKKTADLIKNHNVHNPLVILITDGMPTYSRGSTHPQKDALQAAREFAASHAKLICIGVDVNRDFMEAVAFTGHSNLYIVDDLGERTALIEIARNEKKAYGR